MGFLDSKTGILVLIVAFVLVVIIARSNVGGLPSIQFDWNNPDTQKLIWLAAGAVVVYVLFLRNKNPDHSVLGIGQAFASLEKSRDPAERELHKFFTRNYVRDLQIGVHSEEITTPKGCYHYFFRRKPGVPWQSCPSQMMLVLDAKRVPNPPGVSRVRSYGNPYMVLPFNSSMDLSQLNFRINGEENFNPQKETIAMIKRGELDEDAIRDVTAGAGVPQTGINLNKVGGN